MILKRIYMTWCHGKGRGRFLVGILERDVSTSDDAVFRYLVNEVIEAKKDGFLNYPEFPDLSKTYNVNIKTAFSLRLMPQSRADRGRYLSFWEANIDGLDWFDELGFTQGKLATDTFEFMADFPKKFNGDGIKFISNVAGLSYTKVENDLIKENDELRFELEPKNNCDKMAVKLYKKDIFLGYVKRGHNMFFQKVLNSEVEMRVKAIERNGSINQIYYSIEVV